MNPLYNNGNQYNFSQQMQQGIPYNIPTQMRQGIAQMKDAYRMIRMAQNPQIELQRFVQSNPQIAQLSQMFKGQNMQSVYMNMCKEIGIDPNAIINELRS